LGLPRRYAYQDCLLDFRHVFEISAVLHMITDTLPATAMTLASIALPNWISYTSPASTSPTHPSSPIHISYGLHKRCSSLTGRCADFPLPEDCHGEDRSFCSMWRSVGFLMSLTVVMELATLVGFAVVLLGGRQKREGGWKMVAGLLAVTTACQCAGMAIVVCTDLLPLSCSIWRNNSEDIHANLIR